MLLIGLVVIFVYFIDLYHFVHTNKNDKSREKNENNTRVLMELQQGLNEMERNKGNVELDLNGMELIEVNQLCFLHLHNLTELTLISVSLSNVEFLSLNIPSSLKLLHIFFRSTYKSTLILKSEMLQTLPIRNAKFRLHNLNNILIDSKILNGNNTIHFTTGHRPQHHLSVLQLKSDLYKTKKRWNCYKNISMRKYENIEVDCSDSLVQLKGKNISEDLLIFYQASITAPLKKILNDIYENSEILMKYSNVRDTAYKCLFNSSNILDETYVKDVHGTQPNFVTFQISSYGDLLFYIDMIKSSIKTKDQKDYNCTLKRKTTKNFMKVQLILVLLTLFLVLIIYHYVRDTIFGVDKILTSQPLREINFVPIDERIRIREKILEKIEENKIKDIPKTLSQEKSVPDIKPSRKNGSGEELLNNSTTKEIFHRNNRDIPKRKRSKFNLPSDSPLATPKKGKNNANKSSVSRKLPSAKFPSQKPIVKREPPNKRQGTKSEPKKLINKRSIPKKTKSKKAVSTKSLRKKSEIKSSVPQKSMKSVVHESLASVGRQILPLIGQISRHAIEPLGNLGRTMSNDLFNRINDQQADVMVNDDQEPWIVHGRNVFHPSESNQTRRKTPKVKPFSGKSRTLKKG
ncbi:hypothetical protein SNEBB_000384 [Seison nebaliae]|nr:hypothetical protein SNEBB_000384 [Seison nebaliae]